MNDPGPPLGECPPPPTGEHCGRALGAAVALLTGRRAGVPFRWSDVLDDGQPMVELISGLALAVEILLDNVDDDPETTLAALGRTGAELRLRLRPESPDAQ